MDLESVCELLPEERFLKQEDIKEEKSYRPKQKNII